MKFSAIIPAYNEWPRIAQVITTALQSSSLDEIILIDDGSTDNTREILQSFHDPKFHTILLSENKGKAQAVMRGIQVSRGDYIVMLDADLIGLLPHHIDDLIEPIQNNSADVTLSLRDNSLWIYRILRTDFVSGERVIPKTLFEVSEYFTQGGGFGLEVKINECIRSNRLRICNIPLHGVVTPRKSTKIWWWHGLIADIRMIRDILRSISLPKLLQQIWYFSRFSSYVVKHK